MENLFIIGNGFDLAHGLPTGYGDFKSFLHKTYKLPDWLYDDTEWLTDTDFPESQLDGDGGEVYDFDAYARVYFSICNQLNPLTEDNVIDWKDFENNLAKITLLEVDGTDINDREGSQTAHLREQMSLEFNNAYHGMTEYFFEQWVESIINSAAYSNLVKSSCKKLKEVVLANRRDSYFLTTNYTPLLEAAYGISDDKVLHIHGRFGKGSLVVGHGDKTLPDDDNYNPLNFDFSGAKRNSLKPVEEIVKSNRRFFEQLSTVNKIYIIGSSVLDGNKIDLPYLEEVLSHIEGKVTIYLDSFGMTLGKLKEKEAFLIGLSEKVEKVEVIDSFHNAYLSQLHH